MNDTKFGCLVVGERFKLPGSAVLLIKETLRAEPASGWINASYNNPNQAQSCYFPYDAPVIRNRSNQSEEARL